MSRGAPHHRRFDDRMVFANVLIRSPWRALWFRGAWVDGQLAAGLGRKTMLVTDFAYREMEVRADSLFKRLGLVLGGIFRKQPAATSVQGGRFAPGSENTPHLQLMPLPTTKLDAPRDLQMSAGGLFRWRRHPQLLNHAGACDPDSDDLERGARSASIRGLFLARGGRFDEARSAFAIAAEEPSIDLTAIPGFWDLSRGGMHAAVDAYEEAGRFREASALGARIRLKYRPRSVSTLPNAPARKTSASGS